MNNRYLKLIFGTTIFASVGIFKIGDAHALASVDFAIEEICSHMMGNLGGLLMAAAGVGGIASAAFGNMKAMYSCLVTAIGAFGINSVLSLHFEAAAGKCNPGGGGTARVVAKASIKDSEVSKFNPEQAAKGFIAATSGATPEGDGSENVESTKTEEVSAEEETDMDLF